MLRNFLIILLISKRIDSLNEDKNYWKQLGFDDIKLALDDNNKINGTAKNVILFVGDGLGPTTITASRIYGKGEQNYLSFERFPHLGVLKTYSSDQYVPDSSATATALFCGVKANVKTSGVDSTVQVDDCEASLKETARLKSIIKWAQEVGKSTGFVTTTRVTHATPSALYSHTANRNWECEAKMPKGTATKCKDIARQLIEDLPGRNIKVIMGGGRQCLQSDVQNSTEDPVDTWACYSKDGRDLIKSWQHHKIMRNGTYKFLTNNQELDELDVNNTEYVLGIFANGHLKMNHERNRGPKGMPSLTNMTQKAIEVLKKNPNGYLLVVEGGLIDFAHHRGHARKALDETIEFSNAISKAIEITEDEKNDTLIIVTSDHSHSLVFPGYAKRSSNILDAATQSKIDANYYTSLLYGTGGPNNYQFYAINNTIIRPNPVHQNTKDFEYSQQAVVLTDEVTHDGTDVYVYAKGPMAHLFHRVHEQTYVAYVISYAAKIGPFDPQLTNYSICITNSIILILGLLFVLNKL